MVWGEEAPAKSGFPVVECLAGLGLIALVGYLASDPIGRSAVNTYETATQQFIDTRNARFTSVFSRLDGAKDLDAPTRGTTNIGLDSVSVNFSDYGSLSIPSLQPGDLSMKSPPFDLDAIKQAEVIREAAEPFVLEEMSDDMRLLVDNRDSSLLEKKFCSASDELSGLCGIRDWLTLLEGDD